MNGLFSSYGQTSSEVCNLDICGENALSCCKSSSANSLYDALENVKTKEPIVSFFLCYQYFLMIHLKINIIF